MNKGINIIVLFAFLSLSVLANHDYNDQDNWSGSCNTGMLQSPIDIRPRESFFCDAGNVKLHFSCEEFQGFNLNNMSFPIDAHGKAYALRVDLGVLQFEAYVSESIEFHMPSEHHINGIPYAGEIQLNMMKVENFSEVPRQLFMGEFDIFPNMFDHYDEFFFEDLIDRLKNMTTGYNFTDVNGSNFNLTDFFEFVGEFNLMDILNNTSYEYAKVAVLLEQDDSAPTDLFNGTDYHDEDQNITFFNLQHMVGCLSERYWYAYDGSATSPPCEENYRWMVAREPVGVKAENLQKLTMILQGQQNAREIQDTNEREVNIVGAPCMYHDAMRPEHNQMGPGDEM